MSKSIESSIVDPWVYDQLSKLNVKYSVEQESVDARVDKALDSAASKQGGKGKNRPDAQVMINNGAVQIPVMIENKGTKNRLIKYTKNKIVKLKNKYNKYDYNHTIKQYAVNGACYYAQVVANHSEFPVVLAVGINGYKDSTRKVNYEIDCYVMNTQHPNIPFHVNKYSDLSFLNRDNQAVLIKNIKEAQEDPDELQRHKEDLNNHLTKVLKTLNQHLSKNIRVSYRIFVVAGSIMAALGFKDDQDNYIVSPLKPRELTSSSEDGQTDGEKIMRKVKAFLKAKALPTFKRNKIINTLKNYLLFDNLSQKRNGTNESPLKQAYDDIYNNLVPAYEMTGGNLDFTGKLFNVMTDWISVPDGDKNDVVLTPRYITNLMAKLAQVDMNSYVWDWALGSGGFLISAMNDMLRDAKKRITSPNKLGKKLIHIKDFQLLGIEILPDIYVLAVLNMILMGDGSSNILNEDSLQDFNGDYSYDKDKGKPFPASVLLLNPPYSAEGNGMIFLDKATQKMNHGYACIIVERSSGNGKSVSINKHILQNNTLLASIKMPDDVFKGAKTNIYLFKVGKPHTNDQPVKFIDFSNDGYSRNRRKKSAHNLVDVDHAHARYKELEHVVEFGDIDDAKWLKNNKTYIIGYIDKNSGKDWNFGQHIHFEHKLVPNNCEDTIQSTIDYDLRDALNKPMSAIYTPSNELTKVPVKQLFTIYKTNSFNKKSLKPGTEYDYITRTSQNKGVEEQTGYIDDDHLNDAGTFSLGLLQMTFFYRPRKWYAGQFVRKIKPNFKMDKYLGLYFETLFNQFSRRLRAEIVRNVNNVFMNMTLEVPIKNGKLDTKYIDIFVKENIKNDLMRLHKALKAIE